jgi:hypothetical protein
MFIPSSHRALPRKLDKVLQWYSMYKLAGFSVEALHNITLRVLEKGPTCVSLSG